VRSAEDVIEMVEANTAQPELVLEPVQQPPRPDRTLTSTAQLHSEILSRLGPSPVAEDQLIRDLNASPGSVAPELLTLELEGKITRQAGGLLALA